MVSTTSAYLMVANNLTRLTKATKAEPTVKSDTAYYLANIGKVKTVSDFVGNYRLFAYAMKAYGLKDMTYAKAFVTKLLKDGTTADNALANQLSDQRYKAFAKAFDFAGMGAAATTSAAATTDTVSRFVEQTMEDDQGKSNQGVELALYFKRQAGSITSSYGILADAALLKVVQVAFGIPAESGRQDIDRQAAYLDKVLNIKDLKDPKKLEKLVTRFTAQWDAAGNNTSAPSNALLLTDTAGGGLSADLMLSIANLRMGG